MACRQNIRQPASTEESNLPYEKPSISITFNKIDPTHFEDICIQPFKLYWLSDVIAVKLTRTDVPSQHSDNHAARKLNDLLITGTHSMHTGHKSF